MIEMAANWRSEAEQMSQTPFFTVHQLRVTDLVSEREYVRHVVRHPGGAGVVAVLDGLALCVEQYRPAIGTVTIEIPGGRREPGESPAENAARELFEETGYIAGELRLLGRMHAAPCFSTWVAELFLAVDVHRSMRLEVEGELPTGVTFIPLDEVESLVATGRLTDGKTIAGLLLARSALYDCSLKDFPHPFPWSLL